MDREQLATAECEAEERDEDMSRIAFGRQNPVVAVEVDELAELTLRLGEFELPVDVFEKSGRNVVRRSPLPA